MKYILADQELYPHFMPLTKNRETDLKTPTQQFIDDQIDYYLILSWYVGILDIYFLENLSTP